MKDYIFNFTIFAVILVMVTLLVMAVMKLPNEEIDYSKQYHTITIDEHDYLQNPHNGDIIHSASCKKHE